MRALAPLAALLALVGAPLALAQSSGTWVLTQPSSAEDAGPHEHCWHSSTVQHLVATSPGTAHIDEVCCRCGRARCETVRYAPDPCESHGPYMPGCFRLIWTATDAGLGGTSTGTIQRVEGGP